MLDMVDRASKRNRVCIIHIDCVYTQYQTENMLVKACACEEPWSSSVLKSGFGAALGRQEANWKGRRRQILARW